MKKEFNKHMKEGIQFVREKNRNSEIITIFLRRKKKNPQRFRTERDNRESELIKLLEL